MITVLGAVVDCYLRVVGVLSEIEHKTDGRVDYQKILFGTDQQFMGWVLSLGVIVRWGG
jgi:hypothetical protein